MAIWIPCSILCQIVVVMGNKPDTASEWESVKLKKDIIDLVRKNKDDTGVPVSTFFEQAAREKLSKIKKK